MWRKGLSAGLERHMERGEELMELNRAAFERVAAALDAQESRADDLRTFIREMNRRSEKVVQDLARHGDEFMATQAKRTEEVVTELRDARAERKAHIEALWALIDRLPPPAQAA